MYSGFQNFATLATINKNFKATSLYASVWSINYCLLGGFQCENTSEARECRGNLKGSVLYALSFNLFDLSRLSDSYVNVLISFPCQLL